MKLRLLPLLSLLLTAATATAQSLPTGQDGAAAQANLNALTTGAPTVLPRASSEGLRGSPYADNRWLPAQISLSNGRPLALVPLKYDVLDKRLLMRKQGSVLDSLQLDDRLVAGFALLLPATGQAPARRRVFRRFAEAPLAEQRGHYVEVLHEGRYTLLCHRQKFLLKADMSGAYNAGRRFDEIEEKVDYYLRTPDAALLPVKLTLKALQAAAPALATPLKTAAHAPKTEADWVAVLHAADPEPTK